MEELRHMLISRNYNRNIVNAAIIKAKSIPREIALQKVVKKPNERVIFVLTFNPRLPSISNIMVKHWRTLTKDKKMLEIFPQPPMTAFRQPSNLKTLLCKAKLQVPRRFPPNRIIPGMKKCGKCPIDIHIKDGNQKTFSSTNTRECYRLKGEFNCRTNGVIYLITCEKCKIQYVGQSGRSFHDRIREHMYSIVKTENAIGIHFNSKGHNHLHMNATIVEKVFPNTPQYRLEREDYWIKTLNTKKPKGLNINN